MKSLCLRLTFPVFAIVVGFCFEAGARDADGTLANIVTPNNGMPALVAHGQTFDVTLTRKSELALDNGAQVIALDAEWTGLPNGQILARCAVPDSVPPGSYSLVSRSAAGDDRNVRAVFVYEAAPKNYTVAHISDIRIGSPDHWSSSASIARRAFAVIGESGAALVLITGNLTENGTDEEFRNLLEALDSCALPTYVSPGIRDAGTIGYRRYFGNSTYAFTFGEDAYLSVNTAAHKIQLDTGNLHGRLRQLRRQIKSARWSIGFSHRSPAGSDLRTQLVLFSDSPLDFLICGTDEAEAMRAGLHLRRRVGRIQTPPLLSGAYRLIDVGSTSVSPREVAVFYRTR